MGKNVIIGLAIGLLLIIAGGTVIITNGDESKTLDTSIASVDMSAVPDDLQLQIVKAISRRPLGGRRLHRLRTSRPISLSIRPIPMAT